MANPFTLEGTILNLSRESWSVGQRLAIKTRTQFDDNGEVEEQHEVYEASNTSNQASGIIKVKKQMTAWTEDPSAFQCPAEISREISNLQRGCESTPRLIGYEIRCQDNHDPVPGGYIAYIVMNRVPGENLHKYDDMDKAEQERVQIAFLEAIWDFRLSRLFHYDPRLENVIWDPEQGRCYIVDLEDVEVFDEVMTMRVDPWVELSRWQLIKSYPSRLHSIRNKAELVDYWRKQLHETSSLFLEEVN